MHTVQGLYTNPLLVNVSLRDFYDKKLCHDLILIYVSEEQLVMICLDLMAAGAETTSTTLLWIGKYCK